MAVASSRTMHSGSHGDHARDGHALLLSAGEKVRRVTRELLHPDGGERVVDAAADLLRRYAEVLRREGDVLLHHVRDDLVIRILEYHADAAADLEQTRLVARVHPLDIHRCRPQGRSTAFICFASVDLPEPLCPSTTTKLPRSIVRRSRPSARRGAASPSSAG